MRAISVRPQLLLQRPEVLAAVQLQAKLENFIMITHQVPAARVLPHLPEGVELETFEGQAFVSATYFYNRDFHWAPLSKAKLNFSQSTYRTYVRFKDKPTVYFFATYLETAAAFALEKAFARDAHRGKFHINMDPRQNGYNYFICDIKSGVGDTHFSIQAMGAPKALTPFNTANKLVQFLTMRTHGLFRSHGGLLLDQIVDHKKFTPLWGEMVSGRFDLWDQLGILRADEMSTPYCVLAQPEMDFTFYIPIPVPLVASGKKK